MKPSHLKFVSAISLAAFLFLATGCQDKTDKAELDKFKNLAKVYDQNKAIVREVLTAIDSNNFDKLGQLLADDFVLNAPGLTQPWKKEDIFQAIKAHYASFPDWTHNIEEMIAEG